MSDKKISQAVLAKIKEDKIKPKPKWEFLLKEYSVWGFGMFSLLIGSLAFAVVLYMLRYNDWDIYKNINNNLIGFIILTLPYFWIAVIGFFVWLVNYNIKHTKQGYKYNIKILVAGSICGSIILGALFFGAGAGRAMDDLLSARVPFYKNIINHKMMIWADPDDGLLLGEIIDMKNGVLKIIEPSGQIWEVDIREARIMPMVEKREGAGIKIVGRATGKNEFKAEIVAPIGPGRGCLNNPNPGGCRPPRHLLPPPLK